MATAVTMAGGFVAATMGVAAITAAAVTRGVAGNMGVVVIRDVVVTRGVVAARGAALARLANLSRLFSRRRHRRVRGLARARYRAADLRGAGRNNGLNKARTDLLGFGPRRFRSSASCEPWAWAQPVHAAAVERGIFADERPDTMMFVTDRTGRLCAVLPH